MGVPVVTLAGRAHVGRVGPALLTSACLPDLITTTPDDYVRIAASLAAGPGRPATLRTTLRDRPLALPCDAVTFTRDLESAYLSAWTARTA